MIEPPSPEDPFYSVSQVSKMMGVGPRQVRSWIAENRLEAIMIAGRWRIRKSALSVFVNKEYGA